MRLKKLSCAVLAVLFSFVFLSSCASAADDSRMPSGVTYDLSDYVNNEVLAITSDGTIKVFSYDTRADLEKGIETLCEQSDIVWIQPNFSYENDGSEVEEPMYAEQWALSNDGTFQMEEEENQYPVYDNPFENPSPPGKWTAPGDGTNSDGFSAKSAVNGASVQTAVSGIDINAEEAWERYDGGSREVVVALIDTGVDDTHEELADSIWTNEGEIAGNGIDDDGNGYIDDVSGWNFYNNSNAVYVGSEDNHGTHGAGTIVASSENGEGIAGIDGDTDNVKIMVLKALGGDDGSGTTEDVIEAIQYAEANGASIVNLSLGTSTFDYALYRTMANSGMLFVVAAGNDGTDLEVQGTYPAAYDLDNIISVANLSYDGTLQESSNYSDVAVDLAAPGTYILSTTVNNSYGYMTGTSMAAPMVTAVAAMVYSYYDDISLSDVKQIIIGSANRLDSLEGLVLSDGMLDAGAAMSYDLSALEDSDPEEEDGGSAPVISYETYTQNNASYLTVRVADADADFCLLCYESGERTADDFGYGSSGIPVTTDDENTATFRIVTGGTYTFYAADLAGNETVAVITVTAGQSTDGQPTSDDSRDASGGREQIGRGGGSQSPSDMPHATMPGGNRPQYGP